MFVGIGVGVHRQRFAGSFATSYSSRVIANGGTIEALDCVAAASSLLQSASLLIIPSGYKAGVAYAELPANGNGDLTWSRNSVANRTQSNGNIGSVAANVPRLSYMYGSCPALLLEPQRTNLLTYSQDFNDSSWIKSNQGLGSVPIFIENEISPDGTNNAQIWEFSTNGTNSNDRSLIQKTVSGLSTQVYGSIYVKNKESFSVTFWCNFTTNDSFVLEPNQTQRILITRPFQTSVTLRFGLAGSISGNLTAKISIWGAQVEQGAYATTYIPTTSATATRLADTFTRNNIYTNGLISASGGTWYLEMLNNIAYTRDAAAQGIGIGDSSTTIANGFLIVNTGTGRQVIQKIIASATTNLFTTTTDTIKIAIKWNGTSADVFVNGTKQVSATAFTTTLMEFLNGTGAGIPRWIKTMALYPTPLSDAQCQALTT